MIVLTDHILLGADVQPTEHGLEQPVLGVILDGTGYSDDGTIFGGEIYLVERSRFKRLAHLEQLKLPGGDKAAREPWRMAMSLLFAHYGAKEFTRQLPAPLLIVPEAQRKIINQMLRGDINCHLSSSCGRLFDGVAALLGLCSKASYEGQAAMLLEHQASLADKKDHIYPVQWEKQDDQLIIHSNELARYICMDMDSGTDQPAIAARFHHWLIDSITMVVGELSKATAIQDIVLSGGCMQNRLLLEGLNTALAAKNFSVYTGEKIPVNDGGIALGQAYIGGAQNTP